MTGIHCSITRTNSKGSCNGVEFPFPSCSGVEVVSLSVVRKSQAPSSGNSTAAAHCLRGGKRPVRRHRASARCPCSFYRSLGCLSFLSGSFLSPHRHSVAAAHFLSFRRSSRAPWSPLLASLSSLLSSCPSPARLSWRSVIGGGGGASSCCFAEVGRPTPDPCALGSYFLGSLFVGVLACRLAMEWLQPPSSGHSQKGAPSSRCPSRHPRSARPSVPHRSLRHHVPQSLHIMTPAPVGSGAARACIGRVFRRVRSELARTAAGRVRPQQETFRRPTAILVDPGPSSAALVVIGFFQKPKLKASEYFGLLRAFSGSRVVSPVGSWLSSARASFFSVGG